MITFIRKSLLNAYSALPLLICFVLASFSSFATENTRTRATFLSGEEMFRGVFFLEGQYAQMLPEAQSLKMAYANKAQSASQQALVAQVRQAVLADIKATHPGYFAQFKSVLKSGDLMRVSQTLTQSEKILTQSLERVYHLDKGELAKLQAQAQAEAARQGGKLDAQALEKLVAQMQKGKPIDANNGTCVLVVLLLVAAAAVFVWVAITVPKEVQEITMAQRNNGQSLFHEQIVASICAVAPLIV